MSEKMKSSKNNNYVNEEMYSKIEMYTSFLDNSLEYNFDFNYKGEDIYTEKTKKINTLTSKKLNEIEQTQTIRFLQYETGANKSSIKRLIIIILLFLSIIVLLGRGLFFINEQVNIKNYEVIISETHKSVLKYQAEEDERQRIKAEEEMKVRLANRNINEFTQEQIEKIEQIYRPSDKKIAYLTFDDGPSNNVTPLILDVLKQEKIKATFFVLGSNVTWNSKILKRIRAEGHYIANHGYSHKYNEIYKDYDSLMNDYNLCEQAIKNSLREPNYKTRIFRFPGGSTGGKFAKFKRDAKLQMQEQGIAYLDWNALTCDAEGVQTRESILENLKNTVQEKNTVVILMHDSSTKILTYETLIDVINYLREQGYEFGNLYDLINE